LYTLIAISSFKKMKVDILNKSSHLII